MTFISPVEPTFRRRARRDVGLGGPGEAGDRLPGHSPDPLRAFAHDVRGPLANLSLLVEAIGEFSRTAGDARTTALVERALRSVERLDGMLASTLSRSNGQNGDQSFVPLSLTDVVDRAAALNEPLAREHGVRLHCYLSDPVMVMGDEDLLMRAVDNLLTNAIKFTRRGGMVVCQLGIEDREAILKIEDQGPGLTESDLAKAFQPSMQLSARSPSKLGSNGLGLSIVRQVAERHGGSVTAKNAAKQTGAEFVMTLPRLEARKQAACL